MAFNLDDEEGFMAGLSGASNRVEAPKEEDENDQLGFSVKRRKIVEPFPEPIPFEVKDCPYDICTIDLETDPFAYGRKMSAFVVGVYADGEYLEFWGTPRNPGRCIDDFFTWLKKKRMRQPNWKPLFYAHNGGNFDFHFFTDYLDDGERPFIVDGRICKASFFGTEFRDSYKILPVPLKQLDVGGRVKGEIDYRLMEPEERWKPENQALISEYLEADCLSLHDALVSFIERFGLRLTIAGTALPMLRSYHGFSELDERKDTIIRPYYMGGRVQAFRHGVLRGKFRMIDANSMYPYAMANYMHPVGSLMQGSATFDDNTDFAWVDCENDGALGLRGEDGSLDFTAKRGRFFATAHELRAGLDLGLITNVRVLKAWTFNHKTKFDTFVNTFYDLRLEAKDKGDKAGTLFYKLLLNSSYGKLAMETSKHKDHYVTLGDEEPPLPLYGALEFEQFETPDGEIKHKCIKSPTGWIPLVYSKTSREPMVIWQRPSRSAGMSYLNVATAASITGASRAHLLRAMAHATNPVYCDTDSIICEGFEGDEDEKTLGAWKTEATGDVVFIAGRKMYAFGSYEEPPGFKGSIIDFEGRPLYINKSASKGVNIGPDDIARICAGEVIEYEHPVPRFRLAQEPRYTKRRVRMTHKGAEVDET
jgi:hypothetical protein